MDDEFNGNLELALYSIFAGVVGVIVKLVQGLDAYSIVFFRAAIAAVFILGTIIFFKKLKDLAIVHPWKTLGVGIFQGLSIFFYFSAILQTTVSNAVFLLYTAPIFSVLMAKFFLKEKIEKETLIGIFITLSGIIFIIDPTTFSFDSTQTIGNLLALGAGFFYAAMAMTAKPITKTKSGYYVSFWQYFIISLMFILFLKIESFEILASNWLQLSLIGIICTGVAFILFMEGIRKVKAQKVFIVTALEPLAGTIFAIIILGEVPTTFTAIGAALIFYGVYRATKSKK